MAKTAKTETTVTPATSVNNIDNKPARITYVVVRDGFRVEDREYETPDDPAAVDTKDFWTRVSKNFSWGEKVDIVQYESKKHRVW
jgi:hypothetical protein